MNKSNLLASILIAALLTGCSLQTNTQDSSAVEETVDVSSQAKINVEYSNKEMTTEVDLDNAQKINLSEYKENVVKITEAGVYIISGSAKNKQILVEASDEDKVQLVFNKVSMENTDAPPVQVNSADKVYVTLMENTNNSLTFSGAGKEEVNDDGSTGTIEDAAIYSKCDVVLNGLGNLSIISSSSYGIFTSDDLVIYNPTITIDSKDDAIRAKDSFALGKGKLTIVSQADGIHTSTTDQDNKGWASIDGGELSIEAAGDGLDVATILQQQGGKVSVKTGEGVDKDEKVASLTTNQDSVGFRGRQMEQNESNSSTTEISQKGYKAGQEVYLIDGKVSINSSEDALHSNGNIEILGGEQTLSAADDGIHADKGVTFDKKADVKIEISNEGVEGETINVVDGTITLTALDDGFNASGDDTTASNSNNAFGKRPDEVNDNNVITISGGKVHIIAAGDGIDSNGHIKMTGGIVFVDGPANGGNGSMDYTGEASITGGTLLTAGASGMAQNFSSAENQASVIMQFDQAQEKGKRVSVVDSTGEIIASFVPSMNYQVMTISSPKLQVGKSYKILVGGNISGEVETATDGQLTEGTVLATFDVNDSLMSINQQGEAVQSSNSFHGGMGQAPQRPQ